MERYPPDHILNMDETAVHLFNLPDRVVAKKGQATVKVEKKNFYDDDENKNYLYQSKMQFNLLGA